MKLGRRLGASFVIRAIPQVGGHVCWLSVVDLPEFPSEEAALAKVTQKQLGELEELPLPQDITLLAKCALALSDYRRSIYPQAIEQLEQILTAKALPDAAPARAHLNFLLGNCFGYARSADPATLLPRAVSAYDAALREWSRDRYPTDWATTMNNRGTAYRELPSPDRAANLQEAIRCYELALEEWRKHGFAHYAEVTRSNLSRARLLLAGHSRPS